MPQDELPVQLTDPKQSWLNRHLPLLADVKITEWLLLLATIAMAVSTMLYTRYAGKQLEVMATTLQEMRSGSNDTKNLVAAARVQSESTKFLSEAAGDQAASSRRLAENTGEQVRIIASSAAEAARNAKASLDASIEASRNDQRAWVGVTSFTLPECKSQDGLPVLVAPGCKGRLGVNIENTGRTPALEFMNRSTAILANAGVPFEPRAFLNDPQPLSRSSLFPRQSTSAYVSLEAFQNPITEQTLIEARSGRLAFYFIGEIKYKDIYGRGHATVYCSIIDRDLATVTNCGFGNTAD